MAQAGDKSAIARGIIELGRAMHLQTVAEGIEMTEQADVLRTLGCDLGQGYLFARPLDASDLSERLTAETASGKGSNGAADMAGGAAESGGAADMAGGADGSRVVDVDGAAAKRRGKSKAA